MSQDFGRNVDAKTFRRPLEHIAWWQFLGFGLLLAVVWAGVALDFETLLVEEPQRGISWIHGCVLSAVIIVIGFITIGNTYLQQRRILTGFITVCSYCRKVQLEDRAWQQLESFVSERSLAEFTHGICPSCLQHQSPDLPAGSKRPTEPEKAPISQ